MPAIEQLLEGSGHTLRGRRHWAYTTDVFESHVTTSRYVDDAGEYFVAALALSLRGKGRSMVNLRLDVDDYFPPGDLHDGEQRLHLDAAAAIEGIAAGKVQANRRPDALELLVPRRDDWVVVGETRWEFGQRDDLVGDEEFVDVRTLTAPSQQR